MPQEWWKDPAIKSFFEDKAEPVGAPQTLNPIGGNTGYTGKGPDGVAQPDRRVAGMGNSGVDVHEAEYVLDADTTQAIGPDILASIQSAVKTGKPLDVNKLREAVGEPPKQGFQEGGLVKPIPEPAQRQELPTAPKTGTISRQPAQQTAPQPATLPQKTPDNLVPLPIPKPETKLFAGQRQPAPITERIPPQISERIPQPITERVPQQQAISERVPHIPEGPQKKMFEGQRVPQPETPTPDVQGLDDQATDFLQGILSGNNPYFQQLKDMYSQDLGGAGAASMAAMKQAATQAGMSPEQIASMEVAMNRDNMQATSKMLGELGLGESQMMYQAATDLFGMDMQQKQFEFAQQQYGDQQGQQVANLVNQGWTLDMLQKKYPEMNITQADYDSMKDMSPAQMAKDQWDYSKKVDSINTLLSQGGEANYAEAGTLINDVFGTNVDFSNALTAENGAKFDKAWNNVVGAIGSGISFEDWKSMAITSGDWDDLGMTEGDIKSLYENAQLQSNPVYSQIKQLDQLLDQDLISEQEHSTAVDVLTHLISHPEGVSYSNGYQVVDANGNEVGMFETPEKAAEVIAENPGLGYNLNVVEGGIIGYNDDGAVTPQNTQSDLDFLESIGVEEIPSSIRLQEFKDANGGKFPEGFTAKDWADWDKNTASSERIGDYFDTGETDLTAADKKAIDNAMKLSEKDEGDLTEEEKKTLDSVGFDVANWGKQDQGAATWDSDHSFYVSKVGKLHSNYSYNTGVYDSDGNFGIKMKEDIKDWANLNKGSVVNINGTYYVLEGVQEDYTFDTKTIKSGNDTHTQEYKADALKLKDPETGEIVYETFGANASLKD